LADFLVYARRLVIAAVPFESTLLLQGNNDDFHRVGDEISSVIDRKLLSDGFVRVLTIVRDRMMVGLRAATKLGVVFGVFDDFYSE
jgi:hypothetical protein